MKRRRWRFSIPITFDLLALVIILALMYVAPDESRERFGMDLAVLMARNPPEYAYQLPYQKPDRAIECATKFSDALRKSASGFQALTAIPPHGYQLFLKYEKGIDREFEDTFPAQDDPYGTGDLILQETGTSGR